MAARTPKVPQRKTLLSTSLDGMEDLFDFQTKEEKGHQISGAQESGGNGIQEMEFSLMKPFPDHKFKLYRGQRLTDMVESIRELGILEPILLWKREGQYTILSGHNRVNAAQLAGLTKGPVIIKEELTDAEAVLIVTETNLRQRSFEELSHSEKAHCLKQHYDAIKSQGRRNDLLREIEELINPHEIRENATSLENPKKLDTKEKVSEEYGLSKDRIARYLRIATLIPTLLECLDSKLLGVEAAYDLSFAKEDMQSVMAQMIMEENYHIDTKKSSLIHDYAKKGRLTEEVIRQIVGGEKTKSPKGKGPQPIKIRGTVISRFFDEKQSRKEIEKIVEKALELYFAKGSEALEQGIG